MKQAGKVALFLRTTLKNNIEMASTPAYGVNGPQDAFHPIEIIRREVGEYDIGMDIMYSGICHSDIHQAKNEWGGSRFPMVPGHEILGRVTKIGSKVGRTKVFSFLHLESNFGSSFILMLTIV